MRALISIVVSTGLIMCEVAQLRSEAAAVPLISEVTVTPPEPAARETIRSNEVSLETPTGTLFGTLMLPAANAPVPVVLLVAGSGMTDRDGNTVGLSGKSNTLKLLAEALAQSGIASLRYDKRGVARSAPARTSPNSFDTQADDAARWVAWLGRSTDFRSVGIVGHSEGSFVGIMAAQRGGVRALVSLAGAGRRFDEVMVKQIEFAVQAGQLTKSAADAIKGALAELSSGRTVKTRPSHIPDELWTGLFQPRAQEYLLSIFRYDPSTEIAKLPPKGIQVMIVQGTTDLMHGGDDDPVRLGVAAGVKPVLIGGMNHELKTAPLDRAANDKASEDPRLPLAPGLLSQLIPFLTGALK